MPDSVVRWYCHAAHGSLHYRHQTEIGSNKNTLHIYRKARSLHISLSLVEETLFILGLAVACCTIDRHSTAPGWNEANNVVICFTFVTVVSELSQKYFCCMVNGLWFLQTKSTIHESSSLIRASAMSLYIASSRRWLHEMNRSIPISKSENWQIVCSHALHVNQ